MTKTGEHAWRLDALDPVGGLAFASYRIPEIEAEAIDAAEGPAIFIGAPTFRPVNLTSRSVGLAASRRTFQAGLFINGEEVGFPDLEDAIEFVRRCYVRGGGGAGGAPGGAPPPSEGGPEFPAGPSFEGTGGGEALDTEGIQLTGILLTDLQKYSNLSKDLGSHPPGQSFFITWSKPPSSPVSGAFSRTARTPSVDGADVLTRGAMRLVDDMLRRMPVHTKDREEFIDWLVAFHRLVLAIYKMGVGSFLMELPHRQHLEKMCAALEHFAANRKQTLLFQWLGGNAFYVFERFFLPDLAPWRGTDREWTDALDDLQQWPVPSPLAKALSSPDYSNPTLLNFLAAFLANPPAVNGSPSFVPEIDVALFAAARVVAPCVSSGDLAADFYLRGSAQTDIIHRRMVGRLAETAWTWLVEQLPRRGFGPMLEQAIEQTSSLVAA